MNWKIMTTPISHRVPMLDQTWKISLSLSLSKSWEKKSYFLLHFHTTKQSLRWTWGMLLGFMCHALTYGSCISHICISLSPTHQNGKLYVHMRSKHSNTGTEPVLNNEGVQEHLSHIGLYIGASQSPQFKDVFVAPLWMTPSFFSRT